MMKRTLPVSEFQLRCHVQGLENEYDRLLSENDKLKRRLSQLDPSFGGSGSKKDT